MRSESCDAMVSVMRDGFNVSGTYSAVYIWQKTLKCFTRPLMKLTSEVEQVERDSRLTAASRVESTAEFSIAEPYTEDTAKVRRVKALSSCMFATLIIVKIYLESRN